MIGSNQIVVLVALAALLIIAVYEFREGLVEIKELSSWSRLDDVTELWLADERPSWETVAAFERAVWSCLTVNNERPRSARLYDQSYIQVNVEAIISARLAAEKKTPAAGEERGDPRGGQKDESRGPSWSGE